MDAVLVLVCVVICMQGVEAFSCPVTCSCNSAETLCQNASLHIVPDDLSEGTVKLALTNNIFPALESNHLKRLTRLKIVDLSNNRINTIESGVLCTSEELEILYLNDNNITIQNPDTFYCLKNLRRLNLKNNQISSIPRGLFRNNTKLVVLNLANNNITFLEPDSFQHNLLLSYVIIEANPVSDVSHITSLSKYLNVLDIEFCGRPSVISYQRCLTMETKQSMIEVKDLSPNDLNRSDHLFILSAMKPKLDALGYNERDYLQQNVTTKTVTTLSDEPVFCYCNRSSLWYWCIDKTPNCIETKDAFHNKCTSKVHKIPDTHRTERTSYVRAEANSISSILVLVFVSSIFFTV
jgi:Leucine-rich repeat (LRR) protein